MTSVEIILTVVGAGLLAASALVARASRGRDGPRPLVPFMLVCAGLVAGMLALAGVQSDPTGAAGPEPSPPADPAPATPPPSETSVPPAEPSSPAEPPGDAASGKALFTGDGGCGGCHTLEDAGTSGALGPNLDDARPSYEVLIDIVTHGRGGMPAFGDDGILSEAQIRDLAAYVAGATSGG